MAQQVIYVQKGSRFALQNLPAAAVVVVVVTVCDCCCTCACHVGAERRTASRPNRPKCSFACDRHRTQSTGGKRRSTSTPRPPRHRRLSLVLLLLFQRPRFLPPRTVVVRLRGVGGSVFAVAVAFDGQRRPRAVAPAVAGTRCPPAAGPRTKTLSRWQCADQHSRRCRQRPRSTVAVETACFLVSVVLVVVLVDILVLVVVLVVVLVDILVLVVSFAIVMR